LVPISTLERDPAAHGEEDAPPNVEVVPLTIDKGGLDILLHASKRPLAAACDGE